MLVVIGSVVLWGYIVCLVGGVFQALFTKHPDVRGEWTFFHDEGYKRPE